MWSIGCIFAEMINLQLIFPGKDNIEIDQLKTIFRVLGTPNTTIWPELANYSITNLPSYPKTDLKKMLNDDLHPILDDLGLDLLEKLLCYDPSQRITAK